MTNQVRLDKEVLAAITPCYNSESTICEALASAAANHIPVILVDDGSTDKSVALARNYRQVQVIQQINSGPSVARNAGVLAATAEFIMFLDSDDVLLPGYRKAFETTLAGHPDADVFVCGMEVINEQGKVVDHHVAPSLQPTPFISVLRGDSVPTNGIIVRRDVFARAGLFRNGLHHGEDLDLWLRIAAVTDKWVRMDHTLAVYRLRAGSLSKNGRLMWSGIRQVVGEAANLQVGSPSSRRDAARIALVNGKRYVYVMALGPMLRNQARSSVSGALCEALRLPPLFWPLIIRDGIFGLYRRIIRLV
jgi:succinoglycan biosynthesis protein ExoU